MKVLKFSEDLIPSILSGEKTSTWRVNDDKDLSTADALSLQNRTTREEFAKATVVSVIEKSLGSVTDEDFDAHERYESPEKMYEAFRGYYGDQVGPDTLVKIVRFVLS